MFFVLTAPIDTDTDTGEIFFDAGEILTPDALEKIRAQLGDAGDWFCSCVVCFDFDTAMALADLHHT